MNKLTRHFPALLIGILIGAVVSAGQTVLASKSPEPKLPLEDLRTFTEVFAKIKNDYVEPIEDKDLLENAIHGMLSGLDPHSSYLPPDDYRDLQAGTNGEFGGLGIEVGMEDGFVKVISPIDGTPAARAGVLAGDLIAKLDGTPVKDLSLNDAVELMRGPPGSEIVLTIVREGHDATIEIKLVRDVIKVTSIKERTLEPGYGYVRITQFQSRTGENLREAVSRLKKINGGSLRGLVLDLRNNPGGVLSAAVSVSDAFLSTGMIVYTEGRLEEAKLKFNAKPPDLLGGTPIVVLVNRGSASASEIVAGALKDHSRAVIMGETTFGKGTVQTILPMENGSALKLTTARYFTPSGNSIQATGVVPDIKLSDLQQSGDKALTAGDVSEADLSGHLDGTREESSTTKSTSVDSTEDDPTTPDDELAREDYAIYEALNHLKTLEVTGEAS